MSICKNIYLGVCLYAFGVCEDSSGCYSSTGVCLSAHVCVSMKQCASMCRYVSLLRHISRYLLYLCKPVSVCLLNVSVFV